MNIWDRIDPLAAELRVSTEARRKWRERGRVPGGWHLQLKALALKRGVHLTDEELLSASGTNRGHVT